MTAAGEIPGLAAARLWAASRFPYLATGLFGAQVTAVREIGTVAVDEGWRLQADPALAAGGPRCSSAACSFITCVICCARMPNGPDRPRDHRAGQDLGAVR